MARIARRSRSEANRVRARFSAPGTSPSARAVPRGCRRFPETVDGRRKVEGPEAGDFGPSESSGSSGIAISVRYKRPPFR